VPFLSTTVKALKERLISYGIFYISFLFFEWNDIQYYTLL